MPSALFLPSRDFSVERSPLETKTTNRPLAVISPIEVVKAVLGFDVIWVMNGSGVALDVWADTETYEPAMSTGRMLAHSNQKACFTNSSAIKTRIRAD